MVAASNFMHKRDSPLLMTHTGSKRNIVGRFHPFIGYEGP